MNLIENFNNFRFLHFFVLIAVLPSWSFGNLNLFLPETEVRKLFGVGSELFYVREGVINTYALNFSVKVPANLSKLLFIWQRLTRRQLLYLAQIEYDNGETMGMPTLNISSSGVVPMEKTTFSLTLPCTGASNAEVHIKLHLNITSSNSRDRRKDVTKFTIKRTKICLKGERYLPLNESGYQRGGRAPFETQVGTPLGTLYIATGATCTVTVVVVTLVALVYLKIMRKRARQSINCSYYSTPTYFGPLRNLPLAGSAGENRGGGGGLTSLRSNSYATITSLKKSSQMHSPPTNKTMTNPLLNSGDSMRSSFHYGSSLFANIYPPINSTPNFSPFHSGSSVGNGSSSYMKRGSWGRRNSTKYQRTWRDPRETDPTDKIKRLSIDRWRVVMGNLLQEGTFGRVYEGICQDPKSKKAVSVIVKTVSVDSSISQADRLLRDGILLHGMNHEHLMPLLGVCTFDPRIPLILYPHLDLANLKLYFRGHTGVKGTGVTEGRKLLTRDAVSVAVGVGEGLMHMHKHKILHKDIATRNCMISNDLHVRLGDTALSRDLFPNDYHCLGDNENRPIKWLSQESLNLGTFSEASDVWMFGVFLWELMASSQDPYIEIDPFEMSAYLRDGYRLSQPHSCPDDLFAMMAVCWAPCMDDRPKLWCLVECLKEFHSALSTFV